MGALVIRSYVTQILITTNRSHLINEYISGFSGRKSIDSAISSKNDLLNTPSGASLSYVQANSHISGILSANPPDKIEFGGKMLSLVEFC